MNNCNLSIYKTKGFGEPARGVPVNQLGPLLQFATFYLFFCDKINFLFTFTTGLLTLKFLRIVQNYFPRGPLTLEFLRIVPIFLFTAGPLTLEFLGIVLNYFTIGQLTLELRQYFSSLKNLTRIVLIFYSRQAP